MHQPHPPTCQPAIYICADCAIEHNGDVSSLPQGWDRVKDPHTRLVTVRCPDCLEAIEQDFRDYIVSLGPFHGDFRRLFLLGTYPTPATNMGRAAAAYRGGLV